MSAHRVPPERLGDLLERVAAGQGEAAGGFLASHPDLQERIRALHSR